MKKNVITFGLISGLVFIIYMAVFASLCYNNPGFEPGMVLGYSIMILAFSFIFAGVKNYRDKFNDGFVSFGKAFQIGLYITLIASTFYVLGWLVDFYNFMPDFMDKYVAHQLAQAKAHGATTAQLVKQKADMAGYISMYKNPFGVIILTYMEVLPVGLVVSLIAALILKRSPTANLTETVIV